VAVFRQLHRRASIIPSLPQYLNTETSDLHRATLLLHTEDGGSMSPGVAGTFIPICTASGLVKRQVRSLPISTDTSLRPENLNSYLLSPWNRFLLEKLIVSQLIQKFPAFYGTRKFIAPLTSDRHLSLS
jgi:hypothetical protein